MGLEGTLDALAGGNLAHDERRIEPAVALGDHHAFVGLDALAAPLDPVDVHHHSVAGLEIRSAFPEARDFFGFEFLYQVHIHAPLSSCLNSSSSPRSSSDSARCRSKSGRRCQVLPNACLSRQRRISAWLPDNSTCGTGSPSYTSGRV